MVHDERRGYGARCGRGPAACGVDHRLHRFGERLCRRSSMALTIECQIRCAIKTTIAGEYESTWSRMSSTRCGSIQVDVWMLLSALHKTKNTASLSRCGDAGAHALDYSNCILDELSVGRQHATPKIDVVLQSDSDMPAQCH